MSITDEFARLQDLHEQGALTEDEFTAAKAKVLASENTPPAPVQDAGLRRDVQRLGLQNQILQLDQDWAREQDQLMLVGKGGTRVIPSRERNSFSAILVGSIGLLIAGVSASAPHAGLITFMGVAMLTIAIVAGISGNSKADAYEQAEERYRQCRNDLTDQLDRL